MSFLVGDGKLKLDIDRLVSPVEFALSIRNLLHAIYTLWQISLVLCLGRLGRVVGVGNVERFNRTMLRLKHGTKREKHKAKWVVELLGTLHIWTLRTGVNE